MAGTHVELARHLARAHERLASYTARRRADRTIVDLDPLGVLDGRWSDPAAIRAAAAPPKPTATKHGRPAVPRVPLDAHWLTETQSAQVLDLLDSA